MPASDNGSYVSRFVLKFIEIIAAGLATAVSGYLIAHLSGVMSSPGPAPTASVIQVAPTASPVLSESAPTASTSPSAAAQPPSQTASTGSGAPVPASPPASTGSSSSAPVPTVSKGTAPAPAAAPTVSVGSESLARPTAATSAPSNPHEIGAPAANLAGRKAVGTTRLEGARKPVETAGTAAPSRPQQDSFVSQVRAALRNVEADRAEPALPRQGTSALPAGPAPVGQPGQASGLARAPGLSGTTAAGEEPKASAASSSSVAPSLGAPVEIDSRPIAEAQSPATSPTEKDTGVLSTLEQMLRQDPLAGNDEAPRPPLPVGR